MKRWLFIIVAIGLLFSLLLGSLSGSQSPPTKSPTPTPHPKVTVEHYSLGTQTTQYQIDSAAANIINKSHPWLRVTVIPGLSVMEGIGISEKFPPEKKKYVLLTGDNVSLMQGHQGMPPYPRKFPELRQLSIWWRNQWGFVTYNANLKTPQDLKGKTIAVRPKGGPWDLVYEFLFKYCWGIMDSVKLSPLAPSEFANAMLQGTVDAAHWGSRELYAGVFDLNPVENEMRLKRKAYFISLTKEDYDRGVKNTGNPLGFARMDVPAGAYGNGDPSQGAVSMLFYGAGVATRDIADPEVTYEYVKAINENRDKFAEFSPQWKGAIGGPKMCPFPLVPEKDIDAGGVKYYKQQGWIK